MFWVYDTIYLDNNYNKLDIVNFYMQPIVFTHHNSQSIYTYIMLYI